MFKKIKDLPQYEINAKGQIRNSNKHILKPEIRTGYCRVHLCKNGKAKWYSVHRLVAEAFIPNPLHLPEVNHKDENKLNNNVNNLEWCDSKYNCNYGTRNKKLSETKRNREDLSKPVLCIETGIIYPSMKEAERQTGIFATSIKQVCKKRQKTSGGYHWKYYIERNDE